jgi:hypothetical protein
MRCQACNKELTTLESVRKDKETDQFLDLCNQCYDESERFRFEAIPLAPEPDDKPPPSCVAPLEAFERMVHSGGYWTQWKDGVGLMKPLDRRIFLYNQARDRFLASIENGDKLNVAMDLAFKRMPKRNAIGYHDVGEAIEADLTGEPIHGKIIK